MGDDNINVLLIKWAWRPREMFKKISLFVAIAVLAVMAGFLASPKAVSADGLITISAKALTDHQCNSSEWHFVITQIDTLSHAPGSITVTWANGASQVVPRNAYTGKTAHYTTTANLNSTVTSAMTQIYSEWSGQFNLSHGPCGQPTGTPTATGTPPPTQTGTPPATGTPPPTQTSTPPATETSTPPATETSTPPATETSTPPATQTPPPTQPPTGTPPVTPTDPSEWKPGADVCEVHNAAFADKQPRYYGIVGGGNAGVSGYDQYNPDKRALVFSSGTFSVGMKVFLGEFTYTVVKNGDNWNCVQNGSAPSAPKLEKCPNGNNIEWGAGYQPANGVLKILVGCDPDAALNVDGVVTTYVLPQGATYFAAKGTGTVIVTIGGRSKTIKISNGTGPLTLTKL